MKKLSKIMLSVAAASVVTAAMAVTAMAADTITGTYDNKTGIVTMDGVIGSGASQTLLVLNNVEEFENASDIAYINQIDNSGTFSTFTLAAGLRSDTPSTFNIKVGGTYGTVQTGTLTIEAATPEVTTVKIVIGDADGNGKINATDVNRIGRYIRDNNVSSKATGNTGFIKIKADDNSEVVIGDADGNGKINATDVNRVGRYIRDNNVSSKATGNTGFEVVVIDDTQAE